MRAILVACLLLTGCASNVRWVRAGATTADFDADKVLCEYEATKATASGGDYGMSTAIGAGVAEGMKRAEIIQMCLRARGWTLQRG